MHMLGILFWRSSVVKCLLTGPFCEAFHPTQKRTCQPQVKRDALPFHSVQAPRIVARRRIISILSFLQRGEVFNSCLSSLVFSFLLLSFSILVCCPSQLRRNKFRNIDSALSPSLPFYFLTERTESERRKRERGSGKAREAANEAATEAGALSLALAQPRRILAAPRNKDPTTAPSVAFRG